MTLHTSDDAQPLAPARAYIRIPGRVARTVALGLLLAAATAGFVFGRLTAPAGRAGADTSSIPILVTMQDSTWGSDGELIVNGTVTNVSAASVTLADDAFAFVDGSGQQYIGETPATMLPPDAIMPFMLAVPAPPDQTLALTITLSSHELLQIPVTVPPQP